MRVRSGFAGGLLLLLTACSDGSQEIQFEPGREERGAIHVLRLAGTPYEMGLQHGRLMASELAEGVEFVNTDVDFITLFSLARHHGFIDDAAAQSYPDILDECRGMAEACDEQGVEWTEEMCLALGWGDVMLEHLQRIIAGCTQFVVSGPAVPGGGFYHARSLDWDDIGYLLAHPTIIARRPEGKLGYAVIGFPGNVAPYSGMNEAGLVVASNENNAIDDIDRQGRSHVQMIRQILQDCSSLEDAEGFLRAQDHTTAESLLVSEAASGRAAVFEMSASHMGVRELGEAGLLYMTNHFIHPDMAALHEPYGPDASSRTRLARLEQLLEPDGADSLYGHLDLEGAVRVLRDTTNPYTGVTHPPDLFDGGGTIANNANVYAMVFDPNQPAIYLATGEPPIPQQRFVGLHLGELLGTEPEAATAPIEIP
ncbi:MAG: hypothetical protein JXR96_07255 [Deltaproteobacteria bacterium]|nr:hypothetical protein [Deltaproteobacteria bacterium]